MNTRRRTFTLLVFVLAIGTFLVTDMFHAAGSPLGTTAASRYRLAQASSPQAVKPSNPGNSAGSKESPAYIIEHYATTIRFDNDGTSRRELRVRARILSDEGAQQLSRLAFDYDRKTEHLTISNVDVHQASGGSIGVLPHAVVDRPIAATKDAPAYQDAREKFVRVPALKSGDTLQYAVTSAVTTPPAPGNFWFEHHFLRNASVNEEILEVSIPRERSVKLETAQGAEGFTTTDDTSGETPRRIYRWKILNEGPARKPPEEFPDDAARSSVSAGPPDIQMSTFLTWEDLERWYQQTWERSRSDNAALISKAAELVHARSSATDKLAAYYLFVAQKIRTIDLPPDALGYRPLPPIEVLTQGYGTQLDKHNLLAALAETIGLHPVPVLINSSHAITEGVPSPAQFNQLVTAVQVGPQWVWLDTAPEVAPFRMLAVNLRNKRGLAIRTKTPNVTEDHNAQAEAPIEWMTTPADPPFQATQKVTVTSELSSTGKLSARVVYAVRGDTELLLRVAFHHAPQSQWKNLGQLLAISDGFRGRVTSITASDPEATEKPLEVEYRIAQDAVLHWKNQKAELQFPLPSFGMPELATGTDADQHGSRPIELGTPLIVTAAATISLPPGIIARAPVSVGVKRDYAEYRSTYQSKDGKLNATRELRFLLRQLPAERSRDYSAFARAVRNDESQPIALEHLTSPQNPKTSSVKTPVQGSRGNSTRVRK